MTAIKACVVTVSDRCAAGVNIDEAGPAVADVLRRELRAEILRATIVPDDVAAIRAEVRSCVGAGADLVLTVGGTGLSPRDVTPEAVGAMLEKRWPQLMELARARCAATPTGPKAYLSRGEAGVIGTTLVACLPGSTRGATEVLAAILDLLPHAVKVARGERAHPEHGRPG